jgi:cytochrome c biogenesis protein
MRTALLLLFLLALASVPGSFLPQRDLNPIEVRDYLAEHPTVGPLLDRVGMFDVFASPWFAAVYLLLFVSLIGCLSSRLRLHARALRQPPPAVPRVLAKLPEHERWESTTPAGDVLAAARRDLRRRRWRVSSTELPGGGWALSAEKGYLRETGNLLFHVSLVVLLVGVALGGLFGFRGTVLVKEGDGFANTVLAFDDITPGRRFDAERLVPFTVALDEFTGTYAEDGKALTFSAQVRYAASLDEPSTPYELRVNHPLEVDGAKTYLLGHGYAPKVVVTDVEGNRLEQTVVCLPQGATFLSTCTIKVPDAAGEQLAFEGVFTPTTVQDPETGRVTSVYPAAENPALTVLGYRGDLGLDDGRPQSVYQLEDRSRLEPIGDGTTPVMLAEGETWDLPGGGSLTFVETTEWATFQVTQDPARSSRSWPAPACCSACACRCSSAAAGCGSAPSRARQATARRPALPWSRSPASLAPVPRRSRRSSPGSPTACALPPPHASRPRRHLARRAARAAERPAVPGHRPAVHGGHAGLRREQAVRLSRRVADATAAGLSLRERDRCAHPRHGGPPAAERPTCRPSRRAGRRPGRVPGQPGRDRRAAPHRGRRRGARRLGGHPRHGGRPHAVGEHVRVLLDGRAHGRRDLPGARRRRQGRPHPRRLRHAAGRPLPRPGRHGALHGGGPAGPGPRLVLDQDPRLRGDPLVRGVPALRRGRAALPAARAPRRVRGGGRSPRFPLSVGASLPSATVLDRVSYGVIAFAFPIWTFAIIAGAIWAEAAWGRYWGWDPKETWSFITWVLYAGYLHARATAGWKGTKAAWISVAAAVALVIDYYVVNIFVVGLHSYA